MENHFYALIGREKKSVRIIIPQLYIQTDFILHRIKTNFYNYFYFERPCRNQTEALYGIARDYFAAGIAFRPFNNR